jgi:hypothetical protein
LKSPAEVEYEPVATMTEHLCEICDNFRLPMSCTKVGGLISPLGWCKLWENQAVAGGYRPAPAVGLATFEPRPGIEVRGDAVASEDGPLAAAGVLFVAGDKVLLMRRKDGFWGLPGGKLEPGESAEDAAAREAEEETGVRPTDLKLWTRRIKDGVDFSTYLSRIDEPFEPRYNEEHDAHEWAPVLDYVSSSMDELGL